jgi:YHS domain-containing protein
MTMGMNEMGSSDDVIASMLIELDNTLCPSCVTALTSTLMKYQGVIKATVKPLQNSLILEFNINRISQNSLEEIVQSVVVKNTANHKSHPDDIAIDPVCHMTVKTGSTELYSDYRGKRYFFCAQSCKIAFDEDPESYINGSDGVLMEANGEL